MNLEKSNRLFILVIAAGLLLVGTTVFVQGQTIMRMQKSIKKLADSISKQEARPTTVSAEEALGSRISLLERMELVEKYIETLPTSRSSKPDEPYDIRELGISMEIPYRWTKQLHTTEDKTVLWLNPPDNLSSQGHANPCEIQRETSFSAAEMNHWKSGRSGDACKGVDGPCIDFDRRILIKDGTRPITLLEYDGGWMGREQYVLIDLPGKDVVMRNQWSGDVINSVQARLNENLQDICVEIAKTIDVLD